MIGDAELVLALQVIQRGATLTSRAPIDDSTIREQLKLTVEEASRRRLEKSGGALALQGW